ncbi:MAG: 6-phosphofructokinase [Sulfuricurvum sp. GWF2_44_89]|uniref:ATP-dependent 6-phosphofructokinase n=1 Tax=Sulfuricurvum kujiense TaxID=148813 RepID=A0A2D3WE27_9BACT|nr:MULTISPECIES: 6-phosphofructokinase [Sulfuricurvum]OHD79608.1 MAG: 6-phosphofructokinase [Sulfuricurvum sp. GWF2_44_89]OHD91947.1 MAG: 6-phosphofructokinase [Sulfuricurvum sp. RIFOXYD2_FULL_44_160]OHD94061.1 MAG: 6-phosphofructokinase [Sulfuricurvum sp. RIFOXYD12_FULL_44_77]DAB38688.1 MAG TPA: 6-phosphofructokinase [Sulfuricurvum kujiense]
MNQKIAILCSGGDVSGMNPALKRFVEYAFAKGLHPHFVRNGYEGLIDNLITPADYHDVAGIITRGGTKIGSARSLRFKEPAYRAIAAENLRSHGIDKLIVLGGDGSFRGMERFYHESGIAFCGIPSTIDNDINGTDYCLGVDTALGVIKDAIDQIRDTASSFHRAFVIETMGRDCGYLTLISAITSGAEMCLIPEIPIDIHEYSGCFKSQVAKGRDYFIAVVSEALDSKEVAQWFEKELGFESRVSVLGHIQRGGNPSVYDRLMAYKFVTYAIDALLEGKSHSVICYNKSHFNFKTIDEVALHPYRLDEELLILAREQFLPSHCQM